MINKNNQPTGESSEPIGDCVSIFQRGRKWYANYQLEGRQQRVSLKTTNKKEARARAMKIEVQLDEGTLQKRVEAKSIRECKQLYLEHLQVSGRAAKTIGKYTLVMERILKLGEDLQRSKLSHINVMFVDRYKSARIKDAEALEKKPPSLQTLHDEVTIIRSFINFCIRRKLIATDPLAGLLNPDPPATEQPWWTWDQVLTILESCGELIRPPLTLLANTGMRFGEMQHLTWDDIDYANNVIRIRPKDGWQPKSKDQRVVPMSSEIKSILESMPKISQWVFTMPLTKQQLVTGKQWTEKRLLERLKGVLKKLGLKGHLHTFRHSFISYSISQRESEAQIRAWVGHVDAEIMKHYTHIHDQQSQEAMQRLMNRSIQRPNQGGERNQSA